MPQSLHTLLLEVTYSVWHNPEVLGPPFPELILGFIRGADLGQSAAGTLSEQFEAWKSSASTHTSVPWHFCCAVNPFSMEVWRPLVPCVSSSVPHLNARILLVWYPCQVKLVTL